ncbi:MAG: Type II secretion system protein E [candidate division TA06 bacterium ADurb.Bin417]|uniref:Type II secretion system protein E n=1 Tax=candidate division TA06 bacterium ADurb.Bin417 TaxID=1852828 RepID=A0A1V5MES2_UNCT6|nr:MAG: Type II secretion system protein E [candidate division TA06 bacterium ADurb.Bin417]
MADIESFIKGEQPEIELRADIGPLIGRLETKLKAAGVTGRRGEPEKKLEYAVRLMIELGLGLRASDIHLSPHIREDGRGNIGMLRYRIDGILHPEAEIDPRLLPAITGRWKTVAGCNPTETSAPQNGRSLLNVRGEELDLRISFHPSVLGESITARILSSKQVIQALSLDRIGYARSDLDRILKALKAPAGMIIVSGPAGCGKTTNLYASVRQIAGPGLKVMSVEDPVEFLLPWVVQARIREEFTFPAAIRSFLRSDPDVIMIGEIRDYQTLALAQQAALTGHLVLTTLHAGNAAGALKRLVDIGSDPLIVRDAASLILAQRLVRRLCVHCSIEAAPTPDSLTAAERIAREGGVNWKELPKKFRKAVGCPKCYLGFRGRTVIAETLEMTPEVGRLLLEGAPAEEIERAAVGQGMITFAADGMRRAAAGETTIEEVLLTLALK